MNMFKSNGGFTLVELIVVIAILAILAGIAVPAYSGYINKANDVQDQVDDHYFSVLDKANNALEEAGIETIAAEISRPAAGGSGDEGGNGGEGSGT